MSIRIDGTNTTANPGITGADADTGLQFGTDEVSVVTGGTERAKVTSTGNLGVGISAPDAKLEVKGNGDLSGDAFEYLYSADAGIKVTGNESTVDILSTADGNHSGSLILRGNNKGFGFVHSSDANILEVRSFTANADNWHIHAANGINLDALQRIAGFRKNGGITFNGDTAANNALDDYEQGTWNPNVKFGNSATGVTYSEQQGTYVKIGNLVWLNMVVTLTNNGTGSGTCTVDLPFQSGANDETRGAGSLSLFSGFANIRSQPVTYISGGNQTTMRLMHIDSSAGTADTTLNLTNTNVTNSASWRGFIIYNTF